MTVRELIEQDIDIDVYDDVCEALGIAFCGPQELTEEGKDEFKDVMDYQVTINPNSYGNIPTAIIAVDDKDEAVWKHRLSRAKLFFEAAAGYCSVSDYEKWFGEI